MKVVSISEFEPHVFNSFQAFPPKLFNSQLKQHFLTYLLKPNSLLVFIVTVFGISVYWSLKLKISEAPQLLLLS